MTTGITNEWTNKSNMPLKFFKDIGIKSIHVFLFYNIFFSSSSSFLYIANNLHVLKDQVCLMLPYLLYWGLMKCQIFVGHFVSSPSKREKRDRRDSRGDETEGQGRKRKMKESEGTEEITTFTLYPYLLQGQQAL